MVCVGVVLFGSNLVNLFGILCASWTCMSISVTKLGKFSFITFSNKFSISCSSSSPSGTPMIQMLALLEMSESLLKLSSWFLKSCFFILSWLTVYFFLIFHIIDLNHSFLHFPVGLLCTFFYYLSRAFISSLMLLLHSLRSSSILIACILNSASDRLVIST